VPTRLIARRISEILPMILVSGEAMVTWSWGREGSIAEAEGGAAFKCAAPCTARGRPPALSARCPTTVSAGILRQGAGVGGRSIEPSVWYTSPSTLAPRRQKKARAATYRFTPKGPTRSGHGSKQSRQRSPGPKSSMSAAASCSSLATAVQALVDSVADDVLSCSIPTADRGGLTIARAYLETVAPAPPARPNVIKSAERLGSYSPGSDAV